MRFDILTIFPEFFASPFSHGVLSRAVEEKVVEIHTHDLRAFTHDRHKTVDDRPFGGGEGMVLKPQPIFEAAESIGVTGKSTRDTKRETVILLSAQGQRFTQAIARELASTDRVVLVCGRYEGVDERVNHLLCDRELSIGDYVLSGGELATAVVVDAVVRLLPGVLGNADSSRYESFGASDGELAAEEKTGNGVPSSVSGAGGLLDYPHYTRPAEFRGVAVPEVLAGGDHAAIRAWRRTQAIEKTWRNRPDLLEKAPLTAAERKLLERLQSGQ
ncbi:MAG TPA: tRNA (guanosine(37)-N1)-methyltransferase TrmD [Acidobacteriaceae bacterium]|nr:tRNA (guanosine(37)-N1)-methyltransferase TrmD [Acidobacteriaceae bacterium]